MKKSFLLYSSLLFIISCGQSGGGGTNSNNETPQTYEQKIMSVEDMERADPLKFLSASGTYKENFWGDILKVKCEITNTATAVTFKDAVVRVTYYTKTETSLGSKDYTVYESFPPNSTKTVQMKIDNYKDVHSIGWDVVSAVAN